MVKVQCPKCNREGSLTKKKTQSKGKTYQYWYVEHHIGNKIKWCYLGKYEKLPEEFKKLIHKDTQTDTQNNRKSENLNSRLNNENKTTKQHFLPGSSGSIVRSSIAASRHTMCGRKSPTRVRIPAGAPIMLSQASFDFYEKVSICGVSPP